jgi:hypothetical protein
MEDHQGNGHRKEQSHFPANGKDQNKGTQQGEGGDKEIFRAVVGKFRDFKKIRGNPGHKLARPVIVVKREGKGLEVAKKIPPHVRFNISADSVAPVSYEPGKTHPQYIDKEHAGRYDKETPVEIPGQEFFDGVLGHHGEGQIHGGDQGREDHVRAEELPVGAVVRGKDTQSRTVEIAF